MSERDKFIADMIFELSRQQKDDAQTFIKPRNLTEKEVFQKLSFSFPVVSSEDLELLESSIHKVLSGAKTSLGESFCLDSTFLENVVNLSEKHEKCSSFAPQSIAALVFLKYPEYLLRCNKKKLSFLFSNNSSVVSNYEWDVPNNKRHDMNWVSIFAAFRSLVMRSSSSLVSNLPPKSFIDNSCLVSLQSSISTMDQLVRLLSSADTASVNITTKSSDNLSTQTDAEIESDFLSDLDNDGNDHSLTLEEVFRRVVKEVLTVSNAHTATTQGSIVSMCKEMWMHCIFLYRDILIRTPVLIGSYLSSLCDVLLVNSSTTSQRQPASSSSAAAASKDKAMADLFSFKPKSSKAAVETRPYPSSSECMAVMTVCNVATFLAAAAPPATSSSSSTADAADVVATDAQQLASSREAVRHMLTSKGRLASLVDICERMSSGHTPLKSARSTEVVAVDVESTTFLLDVCTLYSSDLRNGGYTYTASSSSSGAGSAPLSANKHFEALVTSRALAVLVAALVGCVQAAVENINETLNSTIVVSITANGAATSRASAAAADQHNLAALSSRLVKFFSYAILHSPAVFSYLLTSTDFLSALTTLRTSWSNLVGVLRTEGQGGIKSKILEDTLNVFAPSEAVALLSVFLLVQTSAPPIEVKVSELILSLLELATQIVKDFQLPLTPSLHTAFLQSLTLSEDYVVANTTSSTDEVSSGVATPSEVEDSYTPEEVAEKQSSEASGLARHRFVTRTAQRLAKSVELLVSEADAAGHVRALFRNSSVAKGSLTDRFQQLIRTAVATDILKLTTSQLSAINSIEEESHKRHAESSSEVVTFNTDTVMTDTPTTTVTTTSSALPVVNVTAIRGAHEALKKQLKALQSLGEGHASSKAD